MTLVDPMVDAVGVVMKNHGYDPKRLEPWSWEITQFVEQVKTPSGVTMPVIRSVLQFVEVMGVKKDAYGAYIDGKRRSIGITNEELKLLSGVSDAYRRGINIPEYLRDPD